MDQVGVVFLTFLLKSVTWSVDGHSDYVVALLNKDVSLPCRTNSPTNTVLWKYSAFDNNTQTTTNIVFNGDSVTKQYQDRLVVSKSGGGNSMLTITKTRLGDAGTYICMKSWNDMSSLYLVVLAHPECESSGTTVSDGESIQLRCSFHFRGFCNPDIQWNKVNIHYIRSLIQSKNIVTNINGTQNVSSSVNLAVRTIDNGSTISFTVRFWCDQLPGQPESKTDSDAQYNFTWNSSDIVVIDISKDLREKDNIVENDTTHVSYPAVEEIQQLKMVVGFMAVVLVIFTVLLGIFFVTWFSVRRHRKKSNVKCGEGIQGHPEGMHADPVAPVHDLQHSIHRINVIRRQEETRSEISKDSYDVINEEEMSANRANSESTLANSESPEISANVTVEIPIVDGLPEAAGGVELNLENSEKKLKYVLLRPDSRERPPENPIYNELKQQQPQE